MAALDLFSEQGYAATSLRQIADQAGLTHGSLRHHFGSKLNIWQAVADDALDHYQTHMQPFIVEAQSSKLPLKSFIQVVRGFIQVSHQHPKYARLLIQEGAIASERSDYMHQQFQGMHEAIEPLFKKARRQYPRLKIFSNDSFFITLMSMTFFPLLVPVFTESLTDKNVRSLEHRERLILQVLFGEDQRLLE